MKVRKEIMPHARKNISKTNTAYSDIMAQYSEASAQNESAGKRVSDVMDNIIDIRYSTLCDQPFSETLNKEFNF